MRRLGKLILAACMGIVGIAALPLGLGTSPVGAAPEPNPVPQRWQLEVEPGPLRVVSFELPEVGPRSFFYMTFRVINTTGQDLLFAPTFELTTGDGKVLRSGRDVPLAVTRALKEQTQNPLVLDQVEFAGRQLLQGRERAVTGLVVWPANELHPERLTVYLTGFSGETAVIRLPDSEEMVTLRKTLMLDYRMPGEITRRRTQPFEVQERRWIMR